MIARKIRYRIFFSRLVFFQIFPNFNFLEIVIKEISNYKNKNSNINKIILSIFGNAFSKDELDNFQSSSNLKIKEEIIKKFNDKRNERLSLLGEEQSKEIEKRIFLQLIDQIGRAHV